MNLKDTAKRKINIFLQMFWPIFFLSICCFSDSSSIAYLAASIEGFWIILLIFMNGMPLAVEKLMRSRLTRGQFKNAEMIFKSSAGIVVGFTAIITCLLLIFSKVYMVSVLHMPYAVLTFRILIAFFVFFAMILLFQSFFQGTGSYMPTLATGVLFGSCMIAVGILFGNLFEKYGQKVAALLQNPDMVGMYNSAGAGLGIAAAGIVPLLFLLFLYVGTGRRITKQWKKEGLKRTENLSKAARLVLISSLGMSAAVLLRRLPVYLGILFYQGVTKGNQIDLLGSYYGMFESTSLFCVLLLTSGFIANQSSISGMIKREETKAARENLGALLQWCLILAFFLPALSMGVGTSVKNILFGHMQGPQMLLTLSGVFVAVYVPTVLFIGLNLAGGLKRQVTLSLLIALAVYIVFVLAGFKITENNICILAWGRILFAFIACGMNGFYLRRQIHFSPEWIRTVVFPLVSASVTGLILFMLKKALYIYLGDILMLLVSCVIGIICYTIFLAVLKSVRKKELKLMPGGQWLEKAASFLHLL